MELVDKDGNVFGARKVTVTKQDGKVKTLGSGGSPSGVAGGDLTGTYPNPGVNWPSGTSTYNSLYYPLSTNPAGYLTAITSLDVTTALGYTPVNQSGDSMLGFLTLFSDPTAALHAATKQYVDNLAAGINFHSPCHVATTGNLSATYSNGTLGVGATLTSTVNIALVIDGHTLSAGERVLVWQQSAGLQNGIYDVTNTGSVSTPWILTRSADADNSPNGELQNGDFTFIQKGTLYGGYGFILNTIGTITVGTTAINYVQFNTAQAVAAGYGLQELSPNVLSVDTSLIATVSSLSAYLTSATAAATYYPLTNPSGYITSITGTMVTTALGYTPYNATNPSGYITSSALSPYLTSATAALTYYPLTNPSGYITSITSSDVTTALGYTPYNSTNPSGYITSSALTPYLTSSAAASTYYPLTNPSGYTSNLGTVTSVAALTLGTSGTDLSSTVATGTTTPVITLNVPTASATNRGALSSADWTTFNSKSSLKFNTAALPQIIASNTVTYITNSNISTANIQAGTTVTWTVSVSKTAAGTAAPVFTVRFGTAASTADSTLLTFTGAAQTAAIDTGLITIQCVFRSVGSGSSAILTGHYSLVHQLATTGLSTGQGGAFTTSSGFNSTTANAFLGITVNTGASAVWTVNQVFVKIENLL